MAEKPTEIGIQRTAPEAASLPVQRTVDGSGRKAAPQPRRRIAVGAGMLVAGLVMTIGAMIALGSRIGPTAVAVRGTELDAVSVFFSGTSGSGAELALVVVLLLMIPVGIVLGVLGYRRITDDGPSMAAVHTSNSPNAVINNVREGFGG